MEEQGLGVIELSGSTLFKAKDPHVRKTTILELIKRMNWGEMQVNPTPPVYGWPPYMGIHPINFL